MIFLIVAIAFGQQTSAPPAPMSYETYCQKDSREKREAFRTFTPEHRILIAKTQLERWREANRPRLKGDQLALIEEWITVALPAEFTRPKAPDAEAKLKALEPRLIAAFTEAELDAMDQHGPCIAKKTVAKRP
jgi:hypothetical protein